MRNFTCFKLIFLHSSYINGGEALIVVIQRDRLYFRKYAIKDILLINSLFSNVSDSYYGYLKGMRILLNPLHVFTPIKVFLFD